nr:hypothetical transcript [Hymenolepis microstoma]
MLRFFQVTHIYGLCIAIHEHIRKDTIAPYLPNEEKKTLLLIPWEGGDFSERSSAHSYVLTDEFFSSHKMQETLPDPSAKLADNKKTPLLVYTDMDLVAGTLTSSNYKLTDNRDEADIIWTRKHIRDYE